ncbi:hypothetical protein ACROYT_G035081 [Oculina patagonica]
MNLELTIRLARPNDFDEILKLSEGIYEGHDYLPFRYHAWMKMDKMDVILAYFGEKLVGLAACSIVDDGRTVIRRAGRILPEFRGRGVSKSLLQAMYEMIRRRYPNASRERFTTRPGNYPSAAKLVQLDLLRCYVEKKTFNSHRFSAINNSIQIEACTKEYLCDVIFSRPVAQKLFPDNVIMLEFVPIEPLGSNIDYLQQEHDLYFSVEKCSDEDFPRSLSFGVLSPRVEYVHWFVTVYTSDPVLYEAHLLHQLQRACEVIEGDFIFGSCHDKSLTNHGRKVLEEQLHLKIDENLSKPPLKLYETKTFLRQSHL